MLRKTLFASLLASSALALAIASPAQAGKNDRAHEAIAAAEAKIHTAESIGTSTDAPRETAEARAALATAKEALKSGHESTSIQASIRAQALADTAIGRLQQRKDAAVAEARADQREGVAAAQDQAAAAQQQADTAQQQAADANLRADAAQQSAASSAADAAAARNAAAAAAAAQPTQVETTVTTQQPAARRSSTKTTVKKKTTTAHPVVVAPSSSVTTTTRVTQPPQ